MQDFSQDGFSNAHRNTSSESKWNLCHFRVRGQIRSHNSGMAWRK